MAKPKRIEYEDTSGNTETHIAADMPIDQKFGNLQNAYEEGFAASDGIRGVTAASGGRIRHPEKGDAPLIDSVPESIEDENPGLADN